MAHVGGGLLQKFASAVYKAVLGAGARVRARVDTCTWPCDSTEDPVRCIYDGNVRFLRTSNGTVREAGVE